MIRRSISVAILFVVAFTSSAQAPLTFEVATVKRSTPQERAAFGGPWDRFTIARIQLVPIIRTAYSDELGRNVPIEGGPAWINTDEFSILAKAPMPVTGKEIRIMLQNLLAERFHLRVHREVREVDVYALVPARKDGKLGEKVKPWDGKMCNGREAIAFDPNPRVPHCLAAFRPPGLLAEGTSFMALADLLSDSLTTGLDRRVVDRTGITGDFSFVLEHPFPPPPLQAATGPSLFTALEEQLGLKLEKARAPITSLVIDGAEYPDAN